ncbi:MAG TPA: class I SAM-dependent methyltransferase [Solirubrobacterales bacterium]|nr:class I SAM-dependent methyltransferase [Solirubrobacterales bacterium]
MSSQLSYCKLCGLEDFEDSELREVMRDVYSGDLREHPDFPTGREHRKFWEVAMSARALRDFGALRPEAEILGVGAGREATIFWLTKHAKRVFATDLYLADDSWSVTDSSVEMLIDPARATGMDWDPQRLVVQHMDALELRYEDESFDGIFSSGSIEHFGSLDDIRRSVEEMCRVLKPGGVAGISTEFRLEGPPPGMPGTVMFDEAQLREVVVDGVGWEFASPLELSVSDATLATEIDWRSLFEEPPPQPPSTLRQHIRSRLPGRLRWERPEPPPTKHLPTTYPHIVLRLDDLVWTSVHLALVKPGS